MEGALGVELWKPYAFAAFLGFARMFGVLLVLPLLSNLGLRGILRITVAAGLSAPVIYGLTGPMASAELDGLSLLALVVKEVLVGVALGLLIGLPFWAIDLAGGALDFQRMAASSVAATPDGGQTTILGLFLGLVYLAYAFASGAHLLAVGVVHQSFALWPALSFAPVAALEIAPLTGFLQKLFALGLLLAAPIMFALLLSDLAVAALARFAPNMNAMLLAMQVKSLIVGFLLLLYLSVLFTAFGEQLGYFYDLEGLLKTFELGGGE